MGGGRAIDWGLKNCESVGVTGVSNRLGAFQHYSENYINKRIRRSLSWYILLKPSGITEDNFKLHQATRTGKLNYVREIEASIEPGCYLEFNHRALRANLLFNTSVK